MPQGMIDLNAVQPYVKHLPHLQEESCLICHLWQLPSTEVKILSLPSFPPEA